MSDPGDAVPEHATAADDSVSPDPGTSAEVVDHGAAPSEAYAESTGHPAVDGVVTALDGLDEQPVDEHVAVYDDAHQRLRSALAEADRTTNSASEQDPASDADADRR